MTTVQYIAAAAAVLVVVSPWLKALGGLLVEWMVSDDGNHKPPRLLGPSFRDAINNLAGIRTRLVATDALGPEQKTAIDALTLALVDGSDK